MAAYLVEHPPANTAEIAKALGQSPGNIRKHLRTLRENGLVGSSQFGRKVRHRPLPKLLDWMDTVGDRLGVTWEEPERDRPGD